MTQRDELVLVAEDDADLRETLSLLLEGEGYRVATACDGVEALELAAKELPALLLVDLRMPRMSGRELLAEYRARLDTRRFTRTLVVSAAENLEAVSRELGADESVAKPFDVEFLLSVVARLLPR